jgi:hypothetical protein
MKIHVEIVGKAEAKAKLKEYMRLTGNGIETGIKEIGIASARALASKVQPFGLNRVGKFSNSIEKQVKRAIRNANLQGANTSIEAAHKSRRNSKGQVPKDLNTKGQYQGKPFDPQERARLGERKAKNAGLAKAAWVEAGNMLVGIVSKSRSALKKIKVKEEINRHLGKGNGWGRMSKLSLSPTIYLTNNLSYISRTMKNSHVTAALKSGLLNGYKKIDQHIKRETKKLNKI